MMEVNLTTSEQKALNEFLELVNFPRKENSEKQMMPKTALKFLVTRKFDVKRSLELYHAHETLRIREGLVKFDPLNEPLKSELDSGKFTILPVRCKNGCRIALFSAGKHVPSETSHQTTLQGVAYQLDVALYDIDTQRSGILFIYNMSGSKYAHFDYELSQKILSLLKGAYPARLKKVLIVAAPLWFKAPFRILQLFLREKLRDRVHIINQSSLVHHLPIEAIPDELGGMLKLDHQTWLEHCLKVHKADIGDLCPTTPSNCKQLLSSYYNEFAGTCSNSSASSENNSPTSTIKNRNSGNGTPVINGSLSTKVTPISITNNNGEESASYDSFSKSSLGIDVSVVEQFEPVEDDVEGMSLDEFMQMVNDKGKKGLYEEYFLIKMTPPDGSFDIARNKSNHSKNRYIDVLAYDHTRVKLPLLDNEPDSDYINANFVDGYKQKRAFISTQGPLPKTFFDFWRCVWFSKTVVIVMTTRTQERGRVKCGQYWPLDQKTFVQVGNFCIINNEVEQDKDWVITNLTLVNKDTDEKRTVIHLQFTSWPDFGVPQSALAMLEFRNKVREYQKECSALLEWKGHPLGPPIIVHCSAGIGRTGTFITIDISIQRLEDTGKIEIKKTVDKIRSQRAYSIQMPDQYIFCCLALIEFAFCKGLLTNVDLSKFEDEQSDSETEP